ncbi:BgiBsFReDn25 [Biomphalaria glabrata]|nr:BgiBsFReDn25 [Biomphalaria glabrata]
MCKFINQSVEDQDIGPNDFGFSLILGLCGNDIQRTMFWILLVLSILRASSGLVSSTSLSRQYICNLDNRVQSRCARLLPKQYSSLAQCITACLANSSCIGVTRAAGSKCYVHEACALNVSNAACTKANNVTFYTSSVSCPNGGVWVTVGQKCQCSGGWVGDLCTRYTSSCAELVKYGYLTGHEHDVTFQVTNSSNPFKGKCNLISSTAQNTYILKTIGRLHSNCRTWSDYVRGFWDNSFDFWIGLESIRALNKAGLNHVRLDTCFVNGTYEIRGYKYFNFSIDGAEKNYTFSFRSSSKLTNESYGDCLGPVMGAQFSTWDMDNDEVDGQNCATAQEAGWWVKTCNSTCNPMGSWSTRKMDGFNLQNGLYYEVIMYFMSP